MVAKHARPGTSASSANLEGAPSPSSPSRQALKRSESAPGIQRHQVYTTDGAAVTGTPGSWSLTAQERADIKKEVISEIAEITEGAQSFVPTLSAIDAAAGRSWASYARPLARPPPPQDTMWPPYEDRPGMTQVLAASHKRSSTLISSKAPRMLTGMGGASLPTTL